MTRSSRARRRRIIAAIVLVVLVAGAGATYLGLSMMRGQRIEQARVEGMAYYNQGDYEAAIPKLSRYVGENQDDLEALIAFANARRQVPEDGNDHLAHAMTLYGAVLTLDPNNVEAMKHQLMIYERLGRRLEWMDLADRILEHEPENFEAIRLKAMGHFLQDEFDQALELSDRLIEMRPDEMTWRVFQITALQRSDEPIDSILDLCESWRAEHDGDGRYEMLMAEMLLSVGRGAAAEEMIRQGAERGADERQVLQQMVSMLDMIDLADEADELIAETRRRFPDEQWTFEAAVRRHWQAGDVAQAREELKLAEDQLGEFDSDLMRWQTLILVLAGQRDEARQVLGELRDQADAIEDEDRDTVLAWVGAIEARLEYGTQNWREMIEAYRTAIGLAPRDAVLHYLMGEAYMQVGEYAMAVSSLSRAHQSDPNWVAARLAYAEALLMVGNGERATGIVYDLIQRLDEPGLGLYKLFARSWLASGRPTDRFGLYHAETEQAVGLVDLLDWIVERVPQDSEFQELLVRAAVQYNRPEVATRTIENLLEDDEADVALLLSLVPISHQADLGYHHALLEHAESIDGLTLPVADTKARLLHSEGRSDEGLQVVQTALEANEAAEDNQLLRQRMKTSYLLLIDHEDKIDALHELLEVDDELGTAADYVVSRQESWQDRDLIDRAIERLAEVSGEQANRVNLARAEYTLRYESDSESRLAEAQVLVNSVLHRTPNSLDARQLMARLYLAGPSPDLDNAVREMQRALADHPGEPMLYVRLIRMLQQRGSYEMADEYLTRLARLNVTNPEIRQQEIQLLEAQGDPQRVVERMSQLAGEAGIDDPVAMISRLHRAGRHQQALDELESSLAAGDPDASLVQAGINIYLDLGVPHEARRLLEEHRHSLEPRPRYLLTGDFNRQIGEADAAYEAYQQALDLAPEDPVVLSRLANFYLSTGDVEQAFEQAVHGLSTSPDHASLQQILVNASFSLDSQARQDAVQILTDAGHGNSALVQTIELFDGVRRRNGELAPTSNELDDSRRLTVRHPGFLPGWRLAIMLHLQADRRNDAIQLATRATTRLPGHAEPAELATQMLLEAGRLEDALDMARTWRRRSLDRPLEPDLFIASIELALDRPARAAERLEQYGPRLIEERSQYSQRPRIWLEALLRTGDVEAAFEHFKPLFDERDGHWREAWLRIAERSSTHGDDAMEAVEDIFSDSAESLLSLASTRLRYGRRFDSESSLSRSMELAEKAIELDGSQAVSSLMLRAQAREYLQDIDEAITLYREVLSIEPDQIVAMNNLAVMLMMGEQDCQEAYDLASSAHDAEPDVPEIMDTLAQAKLCLGEAGEAERLARKAIEHRDDVAEFHITLGIAKAMQEKWDEAASTMHRLDELVDDVSELTPYVRQRLQDLRAQVEQREAVLSGRR